MADEDVEDVRKDLADIQQELDELKDELEDLLDSGEEDAVFPARDREKHAEERER